jgi:uncharacterized membrane protein YraQ (UPF0718 family)/copper chaperone CopZ
MMDFLLSFLSSAWWVLAEMAPYLILGFFFAGLLSIMISAEWVERHLGGRGLGQVFKASLFGVPLPLCSCGVLPVGASLRRQGASRGATTAFLLSTPQTGVDSIAVTYALLGPFLTVVRPVAALLTGFLGGTLVQVFGERNGGTAEAVEIEGASCSADDCCDDDEDRPKNFVEAMRYGFFTLPRDIGRALLVGVAVTGVIGAVLKPAALEGYLGGGLLPMLAAMAIGIPIYVCATASTPIALSLVYAGLSPGAALVFLISGPATNSAALTTLWQVLGRRTTVIYLITVAVGALATGFAVDAIIAAGVLPSSALISSADAAAVAGHHHHDSASGVWWWIQQLSAVLLLGMVGNALWPRRAAEPVEVEAAAAGERVLEMQVRGMRCNGCVTSLTRALKDCEGVSSVDVRLDDGIARVTGREMTGEQLHEAVSSLGFELVNPEVFAESC